MAKNEGSARVLLTRDGNVIVAKQYSFLAGDLIGTAALCEDGSTELFAENVNPTYREYYQIQAPDDAPYESKKRAVIAVTGWEYDEEFPWVETDANGDALPGTDTDERLTAWLNKVITDYNLLEYWGERTASPYAPGFALMQALSPEEIRELDMREANLGGPASSVPCVASNASLDALNRVISSKNLPFVFVDDEGPLEM